MASSAGYRRSGRSPLATVPSGLRDGVGDAIWGPKGTELGAKGWAQIGDQCAMVLAYGSEPAPGITCERCGKRGHQKCGSKRSEGSDQKSDLNMAHASRNIVAKRSMLPPTAVSPHLGSPRTPSSPRWTYHHSYARLGQKRSFLAWSSALHEIKGLGWTYTLVRTLRVFGQILSRGQRFASRHLFPSIHFDISSLSRKHSSGTARR